MDSPFLDRLGTNYCPSDDDILGIRALVNASTRAVSSIDEDINRLRGSDPISSLVRQRDAHLSFANRHRSLLSPIRRVPDDIFFTIFAHLHIEVKAPMTRTHPSVAVSHVCQRWRQLAISTQSLWNGIHLPLPQYPAQQQRAWGASRAGASVALAVEGVDRWDATVDQMLAIAGVWLARSGHCPVDVTLSAVLPAQTRDCSRFARQIKRCLDLLCSAAHRWRRGHFDLSFYPQQRDISDTLEPLTSLQPHHVPQLESLQFSVFYLPVSYTPDRPVIPTTPFLRGPALRALYLPRGCQKWENLPVNWFALKELCFGASFFPGAPPLTASRAFFLLKECHSLTSCDISICQDSLLSLVPSPPIIGVASLPELQALTIHGPIPNTEFVQALTLPSLHSLHFTNPISGAPPSIPNPNTFSLSLGPAHNTDAALAWARHLGQQLHTVKLNIAWVTPNVLQTLLGYLPSVSDLSLKFWPDSDQHPLRSSYEDSGLAHLLTLQLFHSDSRRGLHDKPAHSICPRIRRLHLDMVGRPGSVTEEGVRDIIASRRRAPKSTQSSKDTSMLDDVTIEFGTMRTMDIRRELETRGVDMASLRFQVIYPSPEAQAKPHRLLYRLTSGVV